MGDEGLVANRSFNVFPVCYSCSEALGLIGLLKTLQPRRAIPDGVQSVLSQTGTAE